jgi:hypothetical protein
MKIIEKTDGRYFDIFHIPFLIPGNKHRISQRLDWQSIRKTEDLCMTWQGGFAHIACSV